jgi:MFS family permease
VDHRNTATGQTSAGDSATASSGRVRRLLMMSVLIACGLSVSLIFTAIGPVLSSLSARYGGGVRGDVIAQLMMTLPSVGVIVGGPLAGLFASRWGARTLLLVALFAYGVVGCAGIFVEEPYTLLGTRLLLGAAAVGVATAATTLIGELLDGTRRTRALGYSSAFASAGSVVSIIAAGGLATYGGVGWPFAIYGVAFVLLLVGIATVPEIATRARTEAVSGFWSFTVSALVPIYAALIAMTVVVFMTGIQISFLLAAKGITEPAAQSWIIACASVGAAVGGLVYTSAQTRFGRDRTFALCIAVMGLGNVLMGTQTDAVVLALGCAMNGIGAGMTIPHFGSKIIERVPAAFRPQALGLMYTMIFAGEFLNPWVVTPPRLHFGIAGAFVIIGAAALGVAGIAYLSRRKAAGAQPT